MAIGFAVLFGVLDFFNQDSSGMAQFARYINASGALLPIAISMLLVGYMLFAPVALIITGASVPHGARESLSSQFGRGLIWASLALRPLWWAALLLYMPVIGATFADGANVSPVEAASYGVSFTMLHTLLNTITEDIGVNILGGAWFVLVGAMMWRHATFHKGIAVSGIVIGAVYLLSAGELFGLNAFAGGNPIPIFVSIAGPLWLLVTGLIAVRRSSHTASGLNSTPSASTRAAAGLAEASA
jgi:predicted secreted protein